MKLILAKIWQFIFGYDHRLWFPEKWDFSKVFVWKEYGGNKGFVAYYKDFRNYRKFCNGIFVNFYDNTFIVKSVVGYTYSSICSIAVKKQLLGGEKK